MTGDQLEKLRQKDPSLPRILILNYPPNPTEINHSAEHLQEIANIEQYLHHSRRVLAGLEKHLASMLQKKDIRSSVELCVRLQEIRKGLVKNIFE